MDCVTDKLGQDEKFSRKQATPLQGPVADSRRPGAVQNGIARIIKTRIKR